MTHLGTSGDTSEEKPQGHSRNDVKLREKKKRKSIRSEKKTFKAHMWSTTLVGLIGLPFHFSNESDDSFQLASRDTRSTFTELMLRDEPKWDVIG